jgi:hypothetical protein
VQVAKEVEAAIFQNVKNINVYNSPALKNIVKKNKISSDNNLTTV